ncbi:hypothetical protein A3D72_00610 [Candidatus Uhrbacteria bacterium RIFCSPHIGHO2_02_FULL_57_19]|uniref:Metallo-beta-lactamase domain-containing protein n=1 Tax=Candidatus Uhrbacteria bacterium RIFCSPHIGHO2_02_FULL_57_19 TaxID=1802391 RepID=A0A1F7U1X5_9BACT|nr:MAG: hypothetical protein A3D72_00610 [Candidatus Uhrbacteria bacterium RIFCSPHIGHO2_02_FULL_57_19]
MRKSVRVKGIAILVLLTLTLCIWYAAIREDTRGLLTVSFLDVGQGDSIFIRAPSGRQVLIDGGANTGVLRELARVVPWYDRSIDVVIPTHPDADHIGGLIDVLARYRVDTVIHSSVEGDTKTFAAFNRAVADEHAREIIAMRGQIIDLGKGARLEILSPDRLVPHVDTNDGCVVARLVYGATAFMLSCDAPQSVENYLVALGTSTLKANVVKAGHHGSKTSSSPLFLGYVAPEYGVFSRGCDNKYGHPAPETVTRFAQFNIPTADTCKDGTITFVSDGQTVVKK